MNEGHRGAWRCTRLLLCGVAAFAATIGAAAAADAQSAEPAAVAASAASTPEPSKSYAIPAYEIVGFDALVNIANRVFGHSDDYKVTLDTIRHNLQSGWVADNDPFKVNQLAHPYQGSMYHGFARSTGHGYWESAGYTFAGSALWEIAGERTPPSRNDQIASGIAGSFLGEPLFRMANLMLERGRMSPRWREISAAAIQPSLGFNRLVYGDRFGGIFPSNDPAYYGRLMLGASGLTKNQPGTSTTTKRGEILADFSMDYGLPGKPGYVYRRPFDYFSFQAIGSSANVIENVMTRGLLVGRDYEVGPNYRGVWGLYGSYDYLAPQFYHLSSTALAVGTTGQWWMSKSNALQGTAMAGIGYAAASTLKRSDAGDRDYHYGLAPQAMLALRWIYGERASLDVTAREYYVSRVAGAGNGFDNIVRTDASFTWRLRNQHGVAIKYLFNRRDASYPGQDRRTQARGSIGIYYVLLGQDRFGAVDWR
ncbi:MAG TPA: DUF3943 domain-containing protein [Albitalea sp.]|nr:DUF3943 domain-containing protein [Albitalea sp.]